MQFTTIKNVFKRLLQLSLRKNILNCCKLQIVFKNKTRLGNNFHFKDQILLLLLFINFNLGCAMSNIMVNVRDTCMMIMNCFCGMALREKELSFIPSRDHCQTSSPSQISDMPRGGFELVQNLSSGFIEWNCAVVITTIPWHYYGSGVTFLQSSGLFLWSLLNKYEHKSTRINTWTWLRTYYKL